MATYGPLFKHCCGTFAGGCGTPGRPWAIRAGLDTSQSPSRCAPFVSCNAVATCIAFRYAVYLPRATWTRFTPVFCSIWSICATSQKFLSCSASSSRRIKPSTFFFMASAMAKFNDCTKPPPLNPSRGTTQSITQPDTIEYSRSNSASPTLQRELLTFEPPPADRGRPAAVRHPPCPKRQLPPSPGSPRGARWLPGGYTSDTAWVQPPQPRRK